jgi:DNA-directed RNA polymerase subunit RPC12/RpoP
MRTLVDVNPRDAIWRLQEENERLQGLLLGEAEGPLEQGWPVPASVELRERLLEFRMLPWRQAKPSRNTFKEFLALADGGPREVLKFAQKYGPLRLKRDGGFLFHPNGEQKEEGSQTIFVATEDAGYYIGRARVSVCLIRLARALRKIKSEIVHGQGQVSRDTISRYWADLDQIARAVEFDNRLRQTGRPSHSQEEMIRINAEVTAAKIELPKTVDGGWRLLMECLEVVVGGNPFGLPVLFSLEQDTRIRLRPVSSLTTYLQIQTLTNVGAHPGATICAGCGTLFTPRRQIAADREAWCPRCGLKAAQRAASRRYYVKNQAEVLKRVRANRERKKEVTL